jgi:hypothetical protein
VWVTVVATGYEDARRRAPTRTLEEPAGEPRIERRPRADRDQDRARRVGANELDVPEFMPRG